MLNHFDFLPREQRVRALCVSMAIGHLAGEDRDPDAVVGFADAFEGYIRNGMPTAGEADAAGPAREDAADATAQATDGENTPRPLTPEDRTLIAKSISTVTPLMEMIIMGGARIELENIGLPSPKVSIVLPPGAASALGPKGRQTIKQAEMIITLMHVMGCRFHVDTFFPGSGMSRPAIHWTMPEGF